jgi:hypothetical protein
VACTGDASAPQVPFIMTIATGAVSQEALAASSFRLHSLPFQSSHQEKSSVAIPRTRMAMQPARMQRAKGSNICSARDVASKTRRKNLKLRKARVGGFGV